MVSQRISFCGCIIGCIIGEDLVLPGRVMMPRI
jgi:hypothetical protein